MVAKRASRAVSRTVALLLGLPSAAFALGLGDIRLLSPLNAPLDAEIEVVDATPEELSSLQAQIASRDTFARYGLDWPMFLSSVQVKAQRGTDGREVIRLHSAESVTEPFVTLLLEVNWSRGRLVREYTMLLDPPVYTPAQSVAGPVAAPAAGATAKGGDITRASAAPAETAPPAPVEAAQPAPSSPAGRQHAPAASASSSAPAAGGEGTHAVRRGDTLSAIASGIAGAGAGTPRVRAWMLAIYQENPGAFDRNMNALRSGAVLRIPEPSVAAAIPGAQASAEIRRQYAAWRGGEAGAKPAAERAGELRLVTPSEQAGSGAAAARGEVRGLQDRVHELEGQLAESKRLLELKNGELARLQSQIAQKGGTAAPAAAAAAPPKPATPAQAPAPSAAPPAAPPAAAAHNAPETSAPVDQAPAPAPTPAPKPHKPVAAPTPLAQPSFTDSLLEYWWAGALLVAALAAALGFKSWRSRRQSAFDDSLGRLAVAGASSLDHGNDTTPIRPVAAAQPEASFLVEESGAHERPRFPGAGASAKTVAADDTISSEAAINLDQGDPLAEADFHMAYGLYDQAADLIRIAIEREPERRDLKLKLLEVFFVWGNKEQFLQAAHELADSRDQAAPGEWEKIVIMGKQLAPDDALFAGGSAGSGAAAGGVDLDLEGGQGSVDFDLLGEPVPSEADPVVDLDIGSALETTAESPVHAATDRNLALDHALEHSIAATGTTREMTATLPGGEARPAQQVARASGAAPDEVDPEFVLEPEAPTVEQPTLALGQGPTLRQKVETALRQSNVEQTAELALDDLGLDLTSLETVNGPGFESAANSPTLVAGLDERSRKIIEDAAQRRGGEPSATGSWHIDEQELEAAFRGEPQPSEEDDPAQTSRLKAVSAENIDFDLGHGEHAEPGHANGAALDLDVGTATVPDAGFTSTQKLASDDLALPDLEPVTMSEVGTKLDLARAYMDMGDPDGARNILEEVLHEGSVAQKQEAQRLMESLPG